ncbi:hypothetical protein KKA69_05975, partial [Patescibacteria group bacterium]|nr:hypothetical protein [Patescibacteria group bacterium]
MDFGIVLAGGEEESETDHADAKRSSKGDGFFQYEPRQQHDKHEGQRCKQMGDTESGDFNYLFETNCQMSRADPN